jgi:hypothetical protein
MYMFVPRWRCIGRSTIVFGKVKLPRRHFVDPSCRATRHDNGTKLSGFRVSRVSKNTFFFPVGIYLAITPTQHTRRNKQRWRRKDEGSRHSDVQAKAKGQRSSLARRYVLRSQGQTGEMQEGERSAPDLGRSVYKVAHCILEDGSTAKGWVFSPLRRATRRLRPAIESESLKPKAQSPKPKATSVDLQSHHNTVQ